MKDIPAQYHSFRKTTLGDNIISFRVDQLYSETVGELVQTDINTEFVLHLERATRSANEDEESSKDAYQKFWSKMHGLLGKLSVVRNTSVGGEKAKLKAHLREEKIIKDSTKELSIKQIAIVCNELERMLREES